MDTLARHDTNQTTDRAARDGGKRKCEVTVVEVRTAVGAPEEPHVQPGDLVSLAWAGTVSYGRVFSVEAIQGTAHVWWSNIGTVTANDGLMWHNLTELRFEERPPQYLAVLRELGDDTRYAFVVAGDDVSDDEYAFEQSRSYSIVSRRTRATLEADHPAGSAGPAGFGALAEPAGEAAESNECDPRQ